MSKQYPISAASLPASASRLNILVHLHQHGPCSIRALLEALQVPNPAQEGAFKRLQKMAKEGVLTMSSLSLDADIQTQASPFETTFQGTAKGTGFARISPLEDAFIERNQTQGAYHGDWVRGWMIGRDEQGRAEAAIESVLKVNAAPWIGTVETRNGNATLKNFDKRRPALKLDDTPLPLLDGMVVQAERTMTGLQVKQILGNQLDATLASEVTKVELELPLPFSDAILEEAQRSAEQPDLTKRMDVRHLPLVTIDGASSRDFDDAVFAESRTDGGFNLWVAIADVSAYVHPDSALDKEALSRATSVYLPDQVIPMLPEVLSNDVCSLNPGVDRLCVLCQMHINEKAEIVQASFSKALMHSHARLTYTEASEKMAGVEDPSLVGQNIKALAMLQHLFDARNGEVRRDRIEHRFKLQGDGQIRPFVLEERTLSHRVIETCMILANVSAARHLQSKQQGVFRVHSQPLEMRYDALTETLRAFGVEAPAWVELDKTRYLQLLETLQQHVEAKRLTPLAQRLPSAAKYESSNGGHFSLGLDAYTHFTSPIRRYPDLLVHRALFDEPLPLDLDAVLTQCNDQEKRAAMAERQVLDRWKCAWLEQQHDRTFTGTVTGIKANGIWVSIEHGIEGFLSIRDIPGETLVFDPIRHELQNESTAYTLGSELSVHVKGVSMGERKIDWYFGAWTPKPSLLRQKL